MTGEGRYLPPEFISLAKQLGDGGQKTALFAMLPPGPEQRVFMDSHGVWQVSTATEHKVSSNTNVDLWLLGARAVVLCQRVPDASHHADDDDQSAFDNARYHCLSAL